MLPSTLFLAFASACVPTDIPWESSAGCEAGFLPDGTTCVPESCGAGRWGNLPVGDDTVHVDASAREGGDGTEAAPYATIQQGLDRAGALGGAMVAVAAGTYPETLDFTTDHADVHLAGRCREMVFLDASVGDGETPGILIVARHAAVEVSGVTVMASSNAGLWLDSGKVLVRDAAILANEYFGVVSYPGVLEMAELVMEGCAIDGNTSGGLHASWPGSHVSLRETNLMNTGSDFNGNRGSGIEVYYGATLVAEGCLIEGNSETGVVVGKADTQVYLGDTTVRGTRPNARGEGGQGITVLEGGTLQAEGCVIDGNKEAGLHALHPGTRVALRDTTIRDSMPNASGDLGLGILAQDGAVLLAEGGIVEGNTTVGLFATAEGTQVTLADMIVRNTQPRVDGAFGSGIEVQGGAILHAEGCLIEGNASVGFGASGSDTRVFAESCLVDGNDGWGIAVGTGATFSAESCLLDGNLDQGLFASDPGTQVTLRNTTVRDTRTNRDGLFGRGIGVQDGAGLYAEGCLIEGNTDIGIAVTDSGTQVGLRNTTISNTKPATNLLSSAALGVAGQDGSRVSASGLVVEWTQGPGIFVNGEGARLECVECSIEGNQFAGAVVTRGASLTIADSTIEGTMPGVNLLGGAGIYAWPWVGAPPVVRVTNSLIQDNPVAGVWLVGNGTYVLTGNTIGGGIGETFGAGSRCGDAILALDGVASWDGTSGLLLQGNAFQDASGAGIFLDGSSAMMSGNTYSGNAMDLVVQNQSCEAMPGYFSEAPRRDLCPIFSYPTCYAEYFFVAVPAEPVESHRRRYP